jgi:hypothetical protein
MGTAMMLSAANAPGKKNKCPYPLFPCVHFTWIINWPILAGEMRLLLLRFPFALSRTARRAVAPLLSVARGGALGDDFAKRRKAKVLHFHSGNSWKLGKRGWATAG